MVDDPLSDVIRMSGARCSVTRCMEASGEWHYRFSPPDGIKFIAVTRGRCAVSVASTQPRSLPAGTAFMMRGGRAFALATDFTLEALDGDGLFTAPAPDSIEPGAAFEAICGHVALDREGGRLLAEALPPLLVLERDAAEASSVGWLLHQLVREMNGRKPGFALALAQLTQLIFVEMVRAHAADRSTPSIGWIAALGDERLAGALRLMHDQPARPWQVGELATQVGLSRTVFATRFSAVLGMGPAAYLTNWRLQLAEQGLRETTRSVSAIARSIGFLSPSAFGAAFRQRFGVTPKAYREMIERQAERPG